MEEHGVALVDTPLPLPMTPLGRTHQGQKFGLPVYWFVHGYIVWDDRTAFDHIELGEYGTLELEGTVIVP